MPLSKSGLPNGKINKSLHPEDIDVIITGLIQCYHAIWGGHVKP